MTRLPLLVLVVLALAGCGGSDEPAGGAVDRGFAAEMIPHHESAVAMARVAERRAQTPFVRRLAGEIRGSQAGEIVVLRRIDSGLARAGVKRGKLGVPGHMTGMDDDPAELESGPDFDRRFLAMMVPHHEGAVRMADAELAHGKDPELKALAAEIRSDQLEEIAAMRRALVSGG